MVILRLSCSPAQLRYAAVSVCALTGSHCITSQLICMKLNWVKLGLLSLNFHWKWLPKVIFANRCQCEHLIKGLEYPRVRNRTVNLIRVFNEVYDWWFVPELIFRVFELMLNTLLHVYVRLSLKLPQWTGLHFFVMEKWNRALWFKCVCVIFSVQGSRCSGTTLCALDTRNNASRSRCLHVCVV